MTARTIFHGPKGVRAIGVRLYEEQTMAKANKRHLWNFLQRTNKTCITKIYLYNFDPLKPRFYIEKNWCLQEYISFFLFLLKNTDRGYLLEPLRQGCSNEDQQSMFWAEICWNKGICGDLKPEHKNTTNRCPDNLERSVVKNTITLLSLKE